MLTLVTNNEHPPHVGEWKDRAGDGYEAITPSTSIDPLEWVLVLEDEELKNLTLGAPQIIWSRSSRRWRRAGWRPGNPATSPYSAE